VKNIIIGPAFPLRGGIADFNEALCRSFIKQQNDSFIISFTLQYPSFLFPGKTQFAEGKSPHDIKIISLINSINPVSWFRTASRIKKEKPDYIIIRYWLPFMAPCLGTIARLVKRNSKIKVIAITDNVIPHEQRVGDRILTKYFVTACDGFITMSKAVKNDLQTFTLNPHIVFTPHPIYDIFGKKVDKSEARRLLKLDEGKNYILFFGFIRKYKGLDLLLEAMGDERIKALNLNLIVAGEFYEDEKPYQDQVAKHSLKNSIVLHTHFIPAEQVKLYFSACDLVAQPYHSATQSGVTQIAYNFDKPMLVTNVGGLSEIVDHGKSGYVVEPDPREIADALVDFYQSKREHEFAENVKQEKGRFSWSYFTKTVEDLFSRISAKQ